MLILAYYKAHISTSTFISMSAGYKWICIKFYQRWVLPGYDQQLRSTCIWIRIWYKKNRRNERPAVFLSHLIFRHHWGFRSVKKTVLNLVKATMHSVKTNRLFSQGPQGGFKTTSKNIKNSKVLFILILVMSHCATVVVNWTLPHSCINSP